MIKCAECGEDHINLTEAEYNTQAMEVLESYADEAYIGDTDNEPVLFGLIRAGLVKIEIVAKPGPATTEVLWNIINDHPNTNEIERVSEMYPQFFGEDGEKRAQAEAFILEYLGVHGKTTPNVLAQALEVAGLGLDDDGELTDAMLEAKQIVLTSEGGVPFLGLAS